MYRIPITLIFADGERVVSSVPNEPSEEQAAEVPAAAVNVPRSRGAKKVLVPPP
jgi:hypothetical protein